MTSSQVHLIEQDIAEARSRLTDTIDRIQDKLTVSGIVDEVMGQAGVPRLESGHNVLFGFLRRHPVPVMIAAAGVGWLMYRRSRRPPAGEPGFTPIDAVPFGEGRLRIYDPDGPTLHSDAEPRLPRMAPDTIA